MAPWLAVHPFGSQASKARQQIFFYCSVNATILMAE